MDTKKIDKANEAEEIINDTPKNALTKEELFKEDEVVIVGSGRKEAYLIFALHEVASKFDTDINVLLILLYLKELGIFNLRISVLTRIYRIGDYEKKGFIRVDYSKGGKKLYRLSDKGLKIVDALYAKLNDNSAYLSSNRHTDIDLESRMKSVISGFFRK